MRDIRTNRSSTRCSDRSVDSGYESVRSPRHSRLSYEEREMMAAFSAANEESWESKYHRHNESGMARRLTAEVSDIPKTLT